MSHRPNELDGVDARDATFDAAARAAADDDDVELLGHGRPALAYARSIRSWSSMARSRLISG